NVWVDTIAASSSLASSTGVQHLLEFRLIRLGFLQANLPCDEHELRHFLVRFLPHGGRVKLRQLLQLGLGELVGIGGDRVRPDTRPIQISVQKLLQDLSLRSKLWILLELVFQDLLGKRREALMAFTYDEEVLSSGAVALGISQSDARVADKGNRHQASV